MYCLTWSLRFLVSEFFCKRLFTIPNTCSITASCLKSSLPWNCGKKVAFTIKKNYMFTWSCIAHLVFYTQFKTTIKSFWEKFFSLIFTLCLMLKSSSCKQDLKIKIKILGIGHFWCPHTPEMVTAKSNMLEHFRKEFFKEIQWKKLQTNQI